MIPLKKSILTIVISGLIFSYNANANIPVLDITSLTEFIKQAAVQARQFKDQMQEARNRLTELKTQVQGIKDIKSISSGNYDDLFSALLNDPTLSKAFALDDWKSIYNDLGSINELRDEFEMWSDNPEVQKKYDDQLRLYSLKQKAYQSSVTRQERIIRISNQFKLADNPAKKADLNNALVSEMVQQQNDAALIAKMDQMMADKIKLEQQKRSAERRAVLMKHNW